MVVINSRARAPVVVKSGGRFVMPLTQQAIFMSLEPMQLQIQIGPHSNRELPSKHTPAVTSDGAEVKLRCMAEVAIGQNKHLQSRAVQRLLSFSRDDIKEVASDIAHGWAMATVAKLPVEVLTSHQVRALLGGRVIPTPLRIFYS